MRPEVKIIENRSNSSFLDSQGNRARKLKVPFKNSSKFSEKKEKKLTLNFNENHYAKNKSTMCN